MSDSATVDEGGVERRGNVAKMVDRLSKDLAAKPPEVAFRKEKPRQQAKARFSYSPKHEDELALQVSDVIDVLGQEEEGWLKGRLKNGTIGLFPANFVEFIPASEEKSQDLDSSVDKEDSENKEEIQPKKPMKIGFGDIIGPGAHVLLRPTKGNAAGQRSSEDRKTAIDFVARTSLDKSNKDEAKQNNNEQPRTSTLPKGAVQWGCGKTKTAPGANREYARVEFPYEAANEDELKLKVGEIIAILSRSTEDPGWWYGEVDGRKGVFPDNFVKLIPADEIPKEKKGAVISPPAVPAKPKPLSGNGRSTTPEPFKAPAEPLLLGMRAGTAPKSISASSHFLPTSSLSPTPDSNHLKDTTSPSPLPPIKCSRERALDNGVDSGSRFPGLPKKPPPSLPTSKATTKPTASSTSSRRTSLEIPPVLDSKFPVSNARNTITAKAASIAEALGRKTYPTASTVGSSSENSTSKESAPDDQFPGDKLVHPTASRPKQNKRPPSTVFLSQLSKETSPSPDKSPTSSPLVSIKPLSFTDNAKPLKPVGTPPPSEPPEPPTEQPISAEEELAALKLEFSVYKRRTDERIAELEARLKKLEK